MFEKSLDEDDNLIKYNAIKNELDIIYDHIAEGIRIRSKCLDEHSKNQRNFFLNLEKQRGAQNAMKKLLMPRKLQTKHIF